MEWWQYRGLTGGQTKKYTLTAARHRRLRTRVRPRPSPLALSQANLEQTPYNLWQKPAAEQSNGTAGAGVMAAFVPHVNVLQLAPCRLDITSGRN